MKRRLANVYLGGAQAGVPELPQMQSVPDAHECCFRRRQRGCGGHVYRRRAGQQEDLKGEPFVGRSGQLLDKLMATVDLFRDKNIYIANTVKCRPPQNRDPLPEEQEACSAWLDSQIALMRPKIIVCVGRISAQRYISKDFRVTKEHGLFYDRNGILYMGTFHPAALLRNPNQKPAAFEDFIALRDKINEICDHTY